MADLPANLQNYLALFTDMSADMIASLASADLAEIVATDFHFKDPFNDIHGPDMLLKLLRKTWKDVRDPQFDVLYWLPGGKDGLYLVKWRFQGKILVLGDWDVTGFSEIRLNVEGYVTDHVDYWDPSDAFYHRIPLLGSILRQICRRAAL